MKIFSPEQTAECLPHGPLVETLTGMLAEYAAGGILCPERAVLPCGDGSSFLLSMPCIGPDLLATKLLTIFPGNRARPVIQGVVTAADARDGAFLFGLDGPTTTARRTAAVTLLGMRLLARRPVRKVLLLGSGAQARGHVAALRDLYPQASLRIRARNAAAVAALCAAYADIDIAPDNGEDDADVVIATTSSTEVIHDGTPDPARLVIGVGAYRPDMVEIGPRIVGGSTLYVDDPVGAPGEAGDYIQAGVDWRRVKPLAAALSEAPPPGEPVMFKSVGCAAWDLAALRVARACAGA